MLSHVDHANPERIPLEACIESLRGRLEAVSRIQGGHTYFQEELRIFNEVANEQGWFLPSAPSELSLPPSDEGNEHQVWFRESHGTFLKATWPGFFGLRVVYRPDEESKASPIDYLERWLLHNAFFADQVRFLGVVTTPDGNRLIIEQPAIAGIPATSEAQIRDFFIGNGWKPFTSDGETAFFDPENGLAISETHRGNLILMPDGLLAPIDLTHSKTLWKHPRYREITHSSAMNSRHQPLATASRRSREARRRTATSYSLPATAASPPSKIPNRAKPQRFACHRTSIQRK